MKNMRKKHILLVFCTLMLSVFMVGCSFANFNLGKNKDEGEIKVQIDPNIDSQKLEEDIIADENDSVSDKEIEVNQNNENSENEDNAENDSDKCPITMDDFVGDYKGFDPFFVTDWDTYEMSEDVDRSTLTIIKDGDSYLLTNFVLKRGRSLKTTELSPINVNEADMTFYVDDGQEDLWDCFSVETQEYGLIIFSKRQKDGQIVVCVDLGGLPESFVPIK